MIMGQQLAGSNPNGNLNKRAASTINPTWILHVMVLSGLLTNEILQDGILIG